ncbi:MAG TPA: DUF1311 domain-containing protein [Candidatus Merdenecus merdavium]|nr:DUF1311 domain-containing protein [Candidatus Merdenecus merdavium]
MKKILIYFLLLGMASSTIGCSNHLSEKTLSTDPEVEQDAPTEKETSPEEDETFFPNEVKAEKLPSTNQEKEKYLSTLQYAYHLDALAREDLDTVSKKVTLEDALKAWDDELNKIYQLFKKSLSSKDESLLIENEKKWIAFRDQSSLEAGKSAESTTLQVILEKDALLQATKARTLELINYYFDERKFTDDIEDRIDTMKAADLIADKYELTPQNNHSLSIVFDGITVLDEENYYSFHIDEYESGDNILYSYSLYMEEVLVSFDGKTIL